MAEDTKIDEPQTEPASPEGTRPSHEKQQRRRRTRKEAVAESPTGPDFVLFVSRAPEPVSFDFGPITSMRFGDRLAWRVPRDKANRFDRHHWCQTNRVRRANEEELKELRG